MAFTSQITDLLGWSFLPPIVARTLVNLGHGKPIGSLSVARQVQLVTVLIVSIAIIRQFLKETVPIFTQTTLYDMFDVNPVSRFDDKKARSNFRRLSLKYHPDKTGDSSHAEYIKYKRFYETLKNPLTRVAYQRFGIMPTSAAGVREDEPGVALEQELLLQAVIQATFGFYIPSVVSLFVSFCFNRATRALLYWHMLLLVSVGVLEFYLASRSQYSCMVRWIWPPQSLAPFQLISLVRAIYSAIRTLMIQVLPRLSPGIMSRKSPDTKPVLSAEDQRKCLATIDTKMNESLKLISMWSASQTAPFEGDSNLKQDLRQRVIHLNQELKTEPPQRQQPLSSEKAQEFLARKCANGRSLGEQSVQELQDYLDGLARISDK